MAATDESGSEGAILPLYADAHISFVHNLDSEDAQATLEYWLMDHLKMSGVYWGLSALCILNPETKMPRDDAIAWVMTCAREDGGFSGNVGHDSHLLYTLSAVQILAIYDALNVLDTDALVAWVAGLQQDDGSFWGDKWGEVDTRFSYCALCCLAIVGRMDAIDVAKATAYVASCRNFDGGFGCVPGAESHAGQVFCCVGALAIGGAMQEVDGDLLAWWLAERQVPVGGLNGRPEKLPDVCYSWWILSAMAILKRLHWINQDKLKNFILSCQDPDNGGISDRPGDQVDVYHTYFGVAGLALLGYPGLHAVDPVYALPVETVERLGLPTLYTATLTEPAASGTGPEPEASTST